LKFQSRTVPPVRFVFSGGFYVRQLYPERLGDLRKVILGNKPKRPVRRAFGRDACSKGGTVKTLVGNA
jgi:hypothetical protein